MKLPYPKAVSENLRLQQVYNTFVKYGLDIFVDTGAFGNFRRYMQSKIYKLDKDEIQHLTTPVKVRLMLQELGTTYVKMGQMASSKADTLPEDWQVELKKLQSDVPPFPVEDVIETITRELGQHPDKIFKDFNYEPLAAASTAQVHIAYLHTGEKVAVKVQRPNIVNQVKSDLAIMTKIANVTERRFSWARNYNISGIINEFSSNVIDELDYLGEAYNTMLLAENMKTVEGTHVPKVYTDLTTSKVLTLEFIDGVKLNNKEEITEAGLDQSHLAEVLLKSMIKQLMIDGFFHADPHPGNLFVNLDTGIVTFLDLGMAGHLATKQRMDLIELLVSLNRKDPYQFGQVMMNLSSQFKPDFDEPEFQRDINKLMSRYMGTMGDIHGTNGSFSDIVSATLALMYDYGLRLDSQLTLAIKAIAQAEEIARNLDTDMNVIEYGYESSKELVKEKMNWETVEPMIKKELTRTVSDVIQRAPSLHKATMKWLDQYESGKLTIHIDSTEINQELHGFQSILKQFAIAVVLAGMIIGSAMAASIPPSQDWKYQSLIAQGGYTISMFIATLLVIKLIWNVWRGDKKAE